METKGKREDSIGKDHASEDWKGEDNASEDSEPCISRRLSTGYSPSANYPSDAASPNKTENKWTHNNAVVSLDFQVLDCGRCNEPLTIPLFQCSKGHAVCDDCRSKFENCSACDYPAHWTRCLIMENVLQSLKMRCQNKTYGCEEEFDYSKKRDHDKSCPYVPCECPMECCGFIDSSLGIYHHCLQEHEDSVVRFQFDCSFDVRLSINCEFKALQEEDKGTVFLLSDRQVTAGNILIMVCRIGPSSSEEGYYYDIGANMNEIDYRCQSFTKNVENKDDFDNLPLTGLSIADNDQFISRGSIKLKVRIRSQGSSPPEF